MHFSWANTWSPLMRDKRETIPLPRELQGFAGRSTLVAVLMPGMWCCRDSAHRFGEHWWLVAMPCESTAAEPVGISEHHTSRLQKRFRNSGCAHLPITHGSRVDLIDGSSCISQGVLTLLRIFFFFFSSSQWFDIFIAISTFPKESKLSAQLPCASRFPHSQGYL